MLRGALVLALGLLGVCLPIAAQQANHSRIAHHHAMAPAAATFDQSSSLSLYRAKILNPSNSSLLLRTGPVRAWSDGGQLASQTALVQIGMAPLGLFPVAYLAPNDFGPARAPKKSVAAASRTEDPGIDGKDFPGEMMNQPPNRVYYTGEIGFLYGQWSGKGSGDYVGSYVWGQASNDKFQITAGAAFENWSGNSPKIRAYPFSR